MYEESNRQLYQDNWDSTKATTKRDGFTNFLEMLSNQFFFFNLQNCYPFKAKAFNFKVTQERTSLGLFLRITSDACQLSLQSKPFELRQKSQFFIFNFSGKCELDLPGLTESAELTPDAFIFCDSNNSLTIRALHKLDILLALVNEDCLLTHTTYWNSQFEEQVFTKKNPSHKLFASILNTTFKFLHTLPLEEHELVIDGIFSFLRPVFNEQRLLTQVQLTHPLEVLKQRADRIIEVRFKEKNLRLTDIAQELGVSVRYLSEAYKHAGTTALKALMQHRLQRANVMLREGHCRELSIREISSMTGFACLSHFSRAFKEEYGLTPTEARTEEILV